MEATMPEHVEVAKRLVDHPDWHWMDGMRYTSDYSNTTGIVDYEYDEEDPGFYPCLDHPATQGCLFVMCCEIVSDVEWALIRNTPDEHTDLEWSLVNPGIHVVRAWEQPRPSRIPEETFRHECAGVALGEMWLFLKGLKDRLKEKDDA